MERKIHTHQRQQHISVAKYAGTEGSQVKPPQPKIQLKQVQTILFHDFSAFAHGSECTHTGLVNENITGHSEPVEQGNDNQAEKNAANQVSRNHRTHDTFVYTVGNGNTAAENGSVRNQREQQFGDFGRQGR